MRNFPVKKGDAYLITDRLTRKYFCGVDIAEGYLVISDRLTVFTDARYFYSANKALKSVNIECVLFNGLSSLTDYFTQNIFSSGSSVPNSFS